MSFANHNILDIALSLIPPTIVQIRKNLGTKVNKYGQMEASYGEWVDVYGIVQPGSEQNEHVEGIDISKKRVTIWLRGIALDGTHLQWAPDQIRYVEKIYNVTGVKDWYPYDNFRECECVEAINLDESQRARIAAIAQRVKNEIQGSKSDNEQDSKQQEIPNKMMSAGDGVEIKKKAESSIFCPDSLPKEKLKQSQNASLVGRAMIRI